MELMDEQEMIRKAYFDATQASGLPPQWIYEFALNLLAAHNAGAQGVTNIPERQRGESFRDWAKRTYELQDAQPMPQTDAARDAKRYQWLREQHEMQVTFDDSECFIVRSPAESAWTVFRPGRTTSLEPVGCFPGELDKAIDAEIERLDRAKGE